jgi:NADH:ubiquinone oxidoreductase subunit 6 (subunit J)
VAASPDDYRRVETVGKALLSGYVVPFEAAGVLLLVVMVGAAYMARRRAQ